jgi:Protein of unknown function (DUF1194)
MRPARAWALVAGLLAALGLCASPAPAAETDESVADTALVLAVDISGSVNAERYALQMEGIAKAFEDPEVQQTILAGPRGAMFVALVEWSDTAMLAIPWTRIASRADAAAFAERVRHAPRGDNQFTCLSRALQLVEGKVLPFLPGPADRTIVDVSGDGRDNCNSTPPPEAIRDELVAGGVTINGLPILEGEEAGTLETWYREHVIGGNAAFLIPARGFKDFARAMRQKFLVEISGGGTPTRVVAAQLPVL